MKQLLLLVFVFAFLSSVAQQELLHLQGQVVDTNHNPVSDVNIFNDRSSGKYISRDNGIFDVWVLPGDSIIISHISFIRKVVTVHQLLVDPIVQLDVDTINIRSVNVSANYQSQYERAMENIKRIEFDFRPKPDDSYSEEERMKALMQSEDEIQRVSSSSLSLVRFSPSKEINKMIAKHKKKKEAKQFSSTKEIENEEK